MLILKNRKDYKLTTFGRGGGGCCKYNRKGEKILISQSLQKQIVNWYHTMLCHPGQTRTEKKIQQHFTWNSICNDVRQHTSTCAACQKQKHYRKKYDHLPAKEAEVKPWENLCIDLIGPYTIKHSDKKVSKTLKCVAMMNPATGWFEIAKYDIKRAITVANIVEQSWLSRYLRPSIVTLDRGREFVGKEFANMVEKDYGIKRNIIMMRNAQANSVIKRVHQALGNLVRASKVHENAHLDPQDPWSGVLVAMAYTIRSKYHTTLQAMPGQLVLSRRHGAKHTTPN